MTHPLAIAFALLAFLMIGLAGCSDPTRSETALATTAPDDNHPADAGSDFAVRHGSELENESLTASDSAPRKSDASTSALDEQRAVTPNEQRQNWSQFRGPHSAGVSNEINLPTEWSAAQNIVWQTALPGPGASSPIVYGEHIYLTCYSGYGVDPEETADVAALQRHLVCVDHATGRVLWKADMPPQSRDFEYVNFINKHGYASSTPVADASGVYVFYGASGVAAYSHEGTLLWQKSCGTGVHEFGSAASPLIYGDLLIINAEIESNSIIAFDKRTGEERWRHSAEVDPQHSRSTPILVNAADSIELVFDYRAGKLAAVDPDNGSLLWECASVDKYQNPTPVVHEGVIYAIGGSRMASVAIRAGGRGNVSDTHQLWSSQRGSRVPSPVYYQGHLYWARESEGIVGCCNAETGAVVYEERLQPRPGEIYASPVIADNKLYYVSRDQGTFVLPAKPDFQLLAHNVIDTDESVFNGSPAVCHGCIFLRSNKALYCIGKR